MKPRISTWIPLVSMKTTYNFQFLIPPKIVKSADLLLKFYGIKIKNMWGVIWNLILVEFGTKYLSEYVPKSSSMKPNSRCETSIIPFWNQHSFILDYLPPLGYRWNLISRNFLVKFRFDKSTARFYAGKKTEPKNFYITIIFVLLRNW